MVWLTALMLLSTVFPAYAQQLTLSPSAKKQLKQLDKPIILRGDYFRAVQVAYEDFSHDLTAKEAVAPLQDPDSAKLVRWLSQIENYDIYIDQTKSQFTVQFDVTLRNNAPLAFGGGARYTIDRTTFAIVDKHGLK